MLCRQLFQDIGAGGIGAGLAFLAAFDAHLVKQDLAQLFRAADVEAFTGEGVDLILQRRHLLGKGVGHAAQRVAIHLDAVALHPGQHRRQGPFQRFIDGGDLFAVQLRLERLPQAQGDIGVLGCVRHGIGNRHPVECDRGFACAQERLDRDRRVIEVPFGQRVHTVPVLPPVQGV